MVVPNCEADLKNSCPYISNIVSDCQCLGN